MKMHLFYYTTGERNADEWDARYKALDIADEQKRRQQNVEYLKFLHDSLSAAHLDPVEGREAIKIVELGCGSAPLAAHLKGQGYNPEASDYSSVITDRLREELDIQTFSADCRDLSMVGDNTYDAILLAGTIYEHDDYHTPENIYREVHRCLKPGGIFVHFLNVYQSTPNNILCLLHNAKSYIVPTSFVRIFVGNLIKPLLNALWYKPRGLPTKKILRKHVHFWLYHPDEITSMLIAQGFSVRLVRFMRFEDALCRLFPIFKKNKEAYTSDTAHRDRDLLVHRVAIRISDYLREQNPKRWGRSMGVCAVKGCDDVHR